MCNDLIVQCDTAGCCGYNHPVKLYYIDRKLFMIEETNIQMDGRSGSKKQHVFVLYFKKNSTFFVRQVVAVIDKPTNTTNITASVADPTLKKSSDPDFVLYFCRILITTFCPDQ